MLEQRLLEAHLAQCPACSWFADHVAAIAEQLRAAALERSRRRLALPTAPVRRSVYARARGVGAVAAVAAMAFAIALQAPAGTDAERPASPRRASPAEVEDAELRTIRLLRREALLSAVGYPDRPSPAFGTQPA